MMNKYSVTVLLVLASISLVSAQSQAKFIKTSGSWTDSSAWSSDDPYSGAPSGSFASIDLTDLTGTLTDVGGFYSSADLKTKGGHIELTAGLTVKSWTTSGSSIISGTDKDSLKEFVVDTSSGVSINNDQVFNDVRVEFDLVQIHAVISGVNFQIQTSGNFLLDEDGKIDITFAHATRAVIRSMGVLKDFELKGAFWLRRQSDIPTPIQVCYYPQSSLEWATGYNTTMIKGATLTCGSSLCEADNFYAIKTSGSVVCTLSMIVCALVALFMF